MSLDLVSEKHPADFKPGEVLPRSDSVRESFEWLERESESGTGNGDDLGL